MMSFLINTAIYFAAALVGIIAADAILSGFSVTGWISYVTVAIIFAVIQAVPAPFIAKMAEKNAPAFMGGIGLVSTFVSLLITSLVAGSLSIDGASTWLAATVIVWLFAAVAAFLLPFLLVKKIVNERRD